MPSQEQDKPTQPAKAAKWWLALMGVVLFSITVAPDYAMQHVVFGVFIVIAIHLLVAFFRRGQVTNNKPAASALRSEPQALSNTAVLVLLVPLALVGVIGILAGGTSAWHAYFCALAIGAFTAMCWLFPSRPTKKKDAASGHA